MHRPASLWLAAGNQSQERGDLRQAESCYREALQRQPDLAEAHNGLGIVLAQQGDLSGAEASFRQVVRLVPGAAPAHSNLGNVLKDQGRLEEAEACHREALRWQPEEAGSHNNLGLVLAAQGRLADAEDCYRQALGRQPNFPAAYHNLGLVLMDPRQGRLPEAEACFRRALELWPDFPAALHSCARVLQAQGKFAEAGTCYQRVLQLQPNDAGTLHDLGVVYYRQQQYEEAKAYFQRALQLNPACADIHINLGNVWRDQGQADQARACYQRALQLAPGNALAHHNLGAVLYDQGRLDEGLASCQRALELDPQFAIAHHTLAQMLLLRGNLAQGWQELEWRWRYKRRLPDLPVPYWNGSPLRGRTILLTEEQGLGDTIQFIRYAALLKQQGATVVFACKALMHELLAGCPGLDRLVLLPGPPGPCDCFAPLLSLPRLLGTTLDNIPASVPYLFPPPERVARWQQKLSGLSGFKIGICWQGSPGNQRDRLRSVRLEQFAPLAQLPGVRLCSLQVGPGRDQLAALGDRFPVTDLGGRFDLASFGDAAAVVKCLDLVITVDTAVAHLAGALGVPVWVALPYVPDWRWLLGRDDSPWYPTMRLFRQNRPGDWDAVFNQMAAVLRATITMARGGDKPRPALLEALPPPPDSAEAHNARGIVLAQQGDLAGAEASFRQVVRLVPGAAPAHSNLGNVLKDQGRLEEAEACHREALRWQPEEAGSHNNLGLVLAAQGRLADAEDCYRQALGRQPNFPAAHYNLGLVLIDLGRLDEAGASLQEALRLDPGSAETHRALGTVLGRQGRAREAEARFRRALEIRPDFAEALHGCGQALQAQDRLAEAEAAFQRGLQLRPNDAEVHYHLGVVSYRQEKFEEAKTYFQRVLELSPDSAGVHIDLGNVWRDQGHLDDARACFQRALQLEPGNAIAHNNLGGVLYDLGRLDEGLACCQKALELDPQCTYAHHSLGQMLLLRGELEQGWQEFEWRWRCKLKLPTLSIPYWDGSPLRGRTILLTEEQGVGDTIQFIRYAALLKQQGATVVFACQARLHEVLAGCPGLDRLVKLPGPAGPCDCFAPLLSLPRLLGTTLATIPASVPYLFPPPERLARWRQELSGLSGFKIGICWQGNPRNPSDRLRSVRLEQFAPLARLPRVRLCSLQVGPGRDQLAALADRFPVTDLGGRFDPASFGDAAAVLTLMDLVVTVDTAVAHLAGALGAPTWVALRALADWRWLLGREDSPWYPTMRLFRQNRPGDWASVFQRIAADLKARQLPSAGPPA